LGETGRLNKDLFEALIRIVFTTHIKHPKGYFMMPIIRWTATLFLTLPLCASCTEGSVINFSSNVSVLENRGYLLEDTNTTQKPWEKTLLNVQLLYEKGMPVNLQNLQICSSKSCWSVVQSDDENIDITQGKEVVNIAENLASIRVRKVLNVEDIDEMIEKVIYTYNAKQGEIKLKTKIRVQKAYMSNLIIRCSGDSISVALTSLSGPKSYVYVNDVHYKREFDNGVIVDIPKGALDRMTILSIYSPGKTVDKYINILAYSITFDEINSSEILDYTISTYEHRLSFPETLNSFMDVYIPIKYKNITPEQIQKRYHTFGYGNGVDEETFEIVKIDDKDYLHIQTNKTFFDVMVFSGKGY
jgi:hypothetical protein